MPVVAIVGAMFAGAGIAAAGGIAAFAAASGTFAAISAVGAIAAGIGVVTGNKALMKIGGIASLAGGIGAFAQGRGWLSADLAKGADGVGIAANAAGGAEAASNTSQMIAEAAPGVADPSSALYTNQMDIASDAAAAGNAGSSAIETASAAAGKGPSSAGLMNSEPLSSLKAQDVGSLGKVASINVGPSTTSSIFDTLKGVGDFMEKNKEMSSMGLKFVGGLFDEKAGAEEDYINARTQNANMQTDLLAKQAANANSVPDLTGLRVRPGQVYNTAPPPIYRAPRAGLINSTGR